MNEANWQDYTVGAIFVLAVLFYIWFIGFRMGCLYQHEKDKGES